MQRLFRVDLTALSTLESSDKTHESSFLVLLLDDFWNQRLARHQRPARRAIRVFPYLYVMKLHGSGVISKETIRQQSFFEADQILDGLGGWIEPIVPATAPRMRDCWQFKISAGGGGSLKRQR